MQKVLISNGFGRRVLYASDQVLTLPNKEIPQPTAASAQLATDPMPTAFEIGANNKAMPSRKSTPSTSSTSGSTMIRFGNLPPEVMQAMCTPMHQILPASSASRTGALYLGSYAAYLESALLQQHMITALVQVLDSSFLSGSDDRMNMEVYRVDMFDSINADLRPHLEKTVRWIDERLRRGINVLVHCHQVSLIAPICLSLF